MQDTWLNNWQKLWAYVWDNKNSILNVEHLSDFHFILLYKEM
jgi:hypothetical protein